MENKKTNILGLREAIVKTIAFFDMFDWPLTANEIWRNLGVKCRLLEVMEALEDGIKDVEEKKSFYNLPGRRAIISERQARYDFTDRKFKRARLLAKIYKLIPWVKLIAVGNLMGAHNSRQESDIDLFIITSRKRVWLTRFFCVALAMALNLRPKPGKLQDKICLSFLVGEEALDLSGLMLENDIYFIYWLAGLTPIYDNGGVYENFMGKNKWLKNYLPNWEPVKSSQRRDSGPGPGGYYYDVADLFFGGLEPWFRKLEFKRLPRELKELMNRDTRVVVNDSILKMHVNDRREEYRERYEEKIFRLAENDKLQISNDKCIYEVFKQDN